MSNRKTHTFEANNTITPAMLVDAAIVAQACFIPACVTCSHDVPRDSTFVVANVKANILHIDAGTNDGNLISTLGEIVRAIGETHCRRIRDAQNNALIVFGSWLERLSGEQADAIQQHDAKLASTIVELESLLPFYLQQIAAWPFSNDGRWPSVVVNECELSSGDEIMNDGSIETMLLNIIVPLPTLLRADNVEQLANVMLALSTNELGEITCAGQRWLIGDGDDTQAAWLANGSLHVWLRSWPSADAIQQGENSDAIIYVLVSEADGEQMKLHGMFATSALAQAHAATLVSDTYGSDATPLEWHSFDGGSEAECNDDDGVWRFIVLWHLRADLP